MGFFKKYPIFGGFIAICLLLFIAGLVFIFLGFGGLGKARKSFTQAERSYRSALSLSPAPTAENAQQSEKNVQELAAALQAQIDATAGHAPSIVSTDAPKTEADMLFQLEAFKEQFTKDAADVEPLGAADDTVGIQLPDDFNFSFSRFLESGTPPPSKFIPAVFEQKEVLGYLLRKLYDSQPTGILSIQRETQVEEIEAQGGAQDNANRRRANRNNDRDTATTSKDDEFQIGELSARVPGAVETLAFRFVFTGYTPSLRLFLKQLEEFELPLVVRSVEVQPYKASKGARTEPASTNNPFNVFGGGDSASETGEKPVTREPVVEENLSQFTVVVEYIKVLVKPPSDVAALEDASSSENPM
ncbi:Amuc_1100 family pilus-like protein [Ruficoccus sp. ZRK36]|uniref:Amuc_1100 family pilus-like protein n=1 Tax=Ruficoccus sp. ZRK36 TaxID=2866311 RepID=UPI001C73445C|nr:Amuc_1100 family pilus-like protein [Ruficoccus sp. ZRK36]QYY36533.1 Amuc_1100 family pilus-like protein [Ruficoccus sp. ZRK36]